MAYVNNKRRRLKAPRFIFHRGRSPGSYEPFSAHSAGAMDEHASMRLTLLCIIATTLPTIIVSTAMIANAPIQAVGVGTRADKAVASGNPKTKTHESEAGLWPGGREGCHRRRCVS